MAKYFRPQSIQCRVARSKETVTLEFEASFKPDRVLRTRPESRVVVKISGTHGFHVSTTIGGDFRRILERIGASGFEISMSKLVSGGAGMVKGRAEHVSPLESVSDDEGTRFVYLSAMPELVGSRSANIPFTVTMTGAEARQLSELRGAWSLDGKENAAQDMWMPIPIDLGPVSNPRLDEILPGAPSVFVGRTGTDGLSSVSALHTKIVDEGPGIVVVHGIGGIGKTSILRKALEPTMGRQWSLFLGASAKSRFFGEVEQRPSGTFASSGEDVIGILGRQVGLTRGVDPLVEFRRRLSRRITELVGKSRLPALLVVDNLEEAGDVQQVAQEVKRLVPGDVAYRLLIATRECPPAWLSGGVVDGDPVRPYRVTPMGEKDSRDLVDEICRDAFGGAKITVRVVEQILQRSAGVPLLVEVLTSVALSAGFDEVAGIQGGEDVLEYCLSRQWSGLLPAVQSMLYWVATADGPVPMADLEAWIVQYAGHRMIAKYLADAQSRSFIRVARRRAGYALMHARIREFVLNAGGHSR